MSETKLQVCKLCGEEKKLIKAHIIPFCFFKPLLKSGVPRQHKLDTNPRLSKRVPNGKWDKNLVCVGCDNLFGKYESYAKKVLIDDFHNLTKPFSDGDDRFLEISNIDFNKIRLFVLSLLWKSSKTKMEAFSKVNLGKMFEERIKQEIITEFSEDFSNFPMLFAFDRVEFLDQLHVEPLRLRIFNLNAYRFNLGRLSISIIVDSQKFSKYLASKILPLTLTSSGPLVIYRSNFLQTGHYSTVDEYFFRNEKIFSLMSN